MYSTCHSCQILRKPEFLDRIWKNTQVPNFVKTVQCELSSVRTDRHDEANG